MGPFEWSGDVGSWLCVWANLRKNMFLVDQLNAMIRFGLEMLIVDTGILLSGPILNQLKAMIELGLEMLIVDTGN